MAGIDSIINTRADAFANNPQGLMQRYAMNQDLLDLLALQKLKQDKEAAQRSLQMQMQAPQNTVKDQLQGQVMDMTRQEVAQAVAPGLQQQGQRMQAEQLQQAMGAGLGGLPAPAGLGMAQGGIVGYAGPEGSTVRGASPSKEELIAYATEIARSKGVPPELFISLLQQESGMDPNTPSSGAGAVGIAQLMPATAEELGVDPYDWQQNIEGGAQYFKQQLDRFRTPELALAAYNAGPGAVTRANGIPNFPETRRYVAQVMGRVPDGEGPPRSRVDEERLGAMSRRNFDARQAQRNLEDVRRVRDIVYNRNDGPNILEQAIDYVSRIPEAIGDAYNNAMRIQGEGNVALYNPELFEYRKTHPDALETPAQENARLARESVRPTRLPPGTRPPGLAMSSDQMNNLLTPPTTDTSTQAPAAPEQQDPRISRWEKQLEELEAEKGSKTSALIDFLLAAGASGGTNLGATLTGGGSGLRARDARLAAQEADIIKNIETLDLENRRLAQDESQFARQLSADQAKALTTAQAEFAKIAADYAQNASDRQLDTLDKAMASLQKNEAFLAQVTSLNVQYEDDPAAGAIAIRGLIDEYVDDFFVRSGTEAPLSSSFNLTQPASR